MMLLAFTPVAILGVTRNDGSIVIDGGWDMSLSMTANEARDLRDKLDAVLAQEQQSEKFIAPFQHVHSDATLTVAEHAELEHRHLQQVAP